MFNISTRIRYGLFGLIELAKSKEGEVKSLHFIAEKHELPLKYMENIFKSFKKSKIIRSARGPEGGYQLIMKPEELSIFDIFDSLEGPLATVDCVEDSLYCKKAEDCILKNFWKDLQLNLCVFLKGKTLKDIMKYK